MHTETLETSPHPSINRRDTLHYQHHVQKRDATPLSNENHSHWRIREPNSDQIGTAEYRIAL
ncbi:MAG: hypothetical protein ACI9JZ_002201 [Lentimonas sp.]|jgi:hypothetical protein